RASWHLADAKSSAGAGACSDRACSDRAKVVQNLARCLQGSGSEHAVVHKVVVPKQYRDHDHRNAYHGLSSAFRPKTMLACLPNRRSIAVKSAFQIFSNFSVKSA